MTARAMITFEADLNIWGCSLWGPSDVAVLISEDRDLWVWDKMGPPSVLVSGGAGWEPAPLWYSLPYVSKHLRSDDG